jgi:hypothetical protein
MTSSQPVDPEPARPSVTVNEAQLRVTCACGRELLINTVTPTLYCECGRRWALQARAELIHPRPDGPPVGSNERDIDSIGGQESSP